MPHIADDDFDESQMFGARAITPPVFSMPKMPTQTPSNPLAKYYRKPGLHVRLPSNGAFLPQGAITFTANGDLPVMPMRASDEILLKSPDALMSGHAIEKLIESCVPDIKAPRLVSQPDLDVLLLAIRAATYGPKMPVNARCPKCSHDNQFECDLSSIMMSMTTIPAENPVRLTDDVIAYVRPYDIGHASKMAVASFEEARKMQALDLQGETITTDVRTTAMGAAMSRIAKVRAAIVADCVLGIVVPEGQVTDKDAILDFLANVNSSWVKMIETKEDELNALGLDKKIPCKCEKCEHEWSTELEFNPATFFA